MAFKAYNREEILEQLKSFFLLGMSITKACETSGICDDQTILNWIKDDDTIRAKITGWQNYVSASAREVWAKEITEKKNYIAAKEWLERKEKKEFSQRQEITGGEGGPIEISNADLNKLTDDELRQLDTITAKVKPEGGIVPQTPAGLYPVLEEGL